jgi:type IV fimbrial biogenesis protein FimT
MSHGFTLIELLVALALTAILATIAYPGFGAWLLDSRRDATVMTTLHAVHAARQFAATRAESIELCGSLDTVHCSGMADWSSGLLIIGADGTVHRSLPSFRSTHGPTLRSNRAVIRFEPGTSYASPATMTICDRRGGGAARAVIVSRSGRPRVSARDASNRVLQC